MKLTGKQKSFLRGRGHALSPIVQIGKEGIGGSLLAAVDVALATHELIKVKVGQGAPIERDEAAETLAVKSGSELVQILGNTILLYRRHPDEPQIELPR